MTKKKTNLVDKLFLTVVNASNMARSLVASVEGLSVDVNDLTQNLIQVIREQQHQRALIIELAARSGYSVNSSVVEPSTPKDKPN